MAQNYALLKQESEVSVPEIVKKMLSQFLIQEVRRVRSMHRVQGDPTAKWAEY